MFSKIIRSYNKIWPVLENTLLQSRNAGHQFQIPLLKDIKFKSNFNCGDLFKHNIQYACLYKKSHKKGIQSINSIEKSSKISKKDQNEAVFNEMIATIRSELETRNLKEVADWLEKALYYNVPHGKQNRAKALVKTFELVAEKGDLTPTNLNLARLLGWCVEMLQCFFLVLDDIMDMSLTRRGQDCWHQKKEVGLIAINDAVLIEQAIFLILRKHFRDHPSYLNLLETFHEVTLWTINGQALDMMSVQSNSRPNLNFYTLSRYEAITIHKTAFYTILLPVKLGILLAGKGQALTKNIEDILLSIGHYFQIQDDILDCFGDPKIIGKIGRDIEEGKCSWPIVIAYEMASSEDKLILQENYGINSEECVSKVKQIYSKLEILSQYQSFERQIYNKINNQIESLTSTSEIPKEVFSAILENIYKRTK